MSFNPYQQLHHTAKYGRRGKPTNPSHWCVFYGDRCLTNPMIYSGCVIELKGFKMQGKLFPDKEKLKIKPYIKDTF